MYFNDVHIIYYVVITIIGAIVGKLINWANYRLPQKQKVISVDYFRKQKQYKENYLVILSNIILYILILYKFGIQETLTLNLELIKYLILTPMLLSVFVIDYKTQTIPNRLTLTIFEIGLIIAFLYGLSNIGITINMLLGMLAGGTIFLIISMISKFIFGKEGLGLGDVKLIIGLGLFFGLSNIAIISVISFLMVAIVTIILLIIKSKKTNESISFGPFIVIASVISILVPFNTILNILVKICTLGLYNNK